jgi:hypothetical protein
MLPLFQRTNRVPLRFGLAAFVLFLLGAASSCEAPTELRLHVHTNVPCTDPTQWKGVAVYVGEPGASLEDKAPALTTTSCNQQGQVGSLVVVPSGSKEAEVGLRIVAGLSYQPEDCVAHHYEGCIVARRAVRFDEHTPIDLDIALTSDCVGLGCDATHTCVDGACSIAGIDTSTPDLGADAGAQVRCGDNGVFCPTTGNVCCLSVDEDAGTSFGECKPSAECPATSIVLNCDDTGDCAGTTDDSGRPGLCLLSSAAAPGTSNPFLPATVALSQCVTGPQFAGTLGLELCQTRLPCQDNKTPCLASSGGPENPLPGYFWCDDTF